VVLGDDVGVRRDAELRDIDAAARERLELSNEHLDVDDHAVGDDRRDARRQDAGRQQVQGVLLLADDHGVPALLPPLNFTT
jgi:hypothetical protein